MPVTISGSTGISQVQDSIITPAKLSGIAGLKAWANVYTANTATCSFNGFNIASVALVSSGVWDITFTTAGYANTSSIAVFALQDNNYNINIYYDRGASNTSKIRLACKTGSGSAYTMGSFTVCAVW
jgi:hypothetical protein